MGRGNKVKFNLDVEKLFGFLPQLPDMLTKGAAASGKPIPPQLQKAMPIIQMICGAAGEVVSFDEQTGLETDIDTGPSGEGRQAYLLNKTIFTDEDVFTAYKMIWRHKDKYIEGIQAVNRYLDFAVSLKFDGVSLTGSNLPNDYQLRQSIDAILTGQAMPKQLCDQFGDMLYFTLKFMSDERKKPKEITENGENDHG